MRVIDTLKAGFNPANSQKTQISTTLATYERILRDLQCDLPMHSILDYGSGLGHGAKLLNSYGANVKAFEPYYNYDKGVFVPQYNTYDQRLSYNKYSVIISNCVLNVLPDDVRDLTLKRMYTMLNVGGVIYINVQSLSAIKKTMIKGNVLSDTEVLTSRGTYQKGFTNKSLRDYITLTLRGAKIEKGIGAVSCKIIKS